MPSKSSRLLAQLDGTEAQELVGPLARLPLAEVDQIVRALRASRKAGREDEKELRKRQRSDRQRHGRKDDEQIAEAAASMVKSLAERAGGTLETLAMLKAHYDDGPRMLALAVAGARAQGYSDTDIGRALSVTPQAIGERYGRRTARVVPDTRPAGNEIQPQDQLEMHQAPHDDWSGRHPRLPSCPPDGGVRDLDSDPHAEWRQQMHERYPGVDPDEFVHPDEHPADAVLVMPPMRHQLEHERANQHPWPQEH